MIAEIRHAGGAIARADQRAGAYSHRDARLSLQLVSMTPTPAAMAASKRYTDEIKAALAPDLTGGVYINFLDGEEALRRTKDAYSQANYGKLITLKQAIDPGDRFSFGFDIRPAA
jgi:hypothetical protein